LAYLSVLFAGFKLFALKNWPPVSMQTLELILLYGASGSRRKIEERYLWQF